MCESLTKIIVAQGIDDHVNGGLVELRLSKQYTDVAFARGHAPRAPLPKMITLKVLITSKTVFNYFRIFFLIQTRKSKFKLTLNLRVCLMF